MIDWLVREGTIIKTNRRRSNPIIIKEEEKTFLLGSMDEEDGKGA
jgi:hypothetical protein